MKRNVLLALLVAAFLLPAAPVRAQDSGMAVIEVPDTSALKYPVRECVVASPRAALTTPGKPYDNYWWATTGAVDNYPADEMKFCVRKFTTVIFRLSRQIEGVWYNNACGRLGTRLILQLQVPSPCGTHPVWKTVGADGASGVRHGPSIGTANVKVPFRFFRPGIYRLRAIIDSYAVPYRPVNSLSASAPQRLWYADKERSIVYLTVQVFGITPIAKVDAWNPNAGEIVEMLPLDPDVKAKGEPLNPMEADDPDFPVVEEE